LGLNRAALIAQFLAGCPFVVVGMVLLFASLDLDILPMGRFIGAKLPTKGPASFWGSRRRRHDGTGAVPAPHGVLCHDMHRHEPGVPQATARSQRRLRSVARRIFFGGPCIQLPSVFFLVLLLHSSLRAEAAGYV